MASVSRYPKNATAGIFMIINRHTRKIHSTFVLIFFCISIKDLKQLHTLMLKAVDRSSIQI